MSKTIERPERNEHAQVPQPVPSEAGVALIPWSQLVIADENARARAAPDAGLPGLAANMLAVGQLQNIEAIPELTKRGKPTGRYAVSAGRRRYLAAGINIVSGAWVKDHPMLVVIRVAEDARLRSLSENVQQCPMHPADEFEAFADLIKEGKTPDAIGAAFGKTPRYVMQRMRLANIAPELLAEFRADRIDLAQLMALAVVDNHERQMAVWRGAAHWQRDAAALRGQMLGEGLPSCDPCVAFVGAEAYTAAGGELVSDLFAMDDGAVIFENAGLVERLAVAKLEEVAQGIREAEGWSWVKVMLPLTSHDRYRFQRAPSTRRRLTADEQAQDDELRVALDEAESAVQLLQDRLDEVEDDAELERQLDEAESLVELRRADRDAYLESLNLVRWTAKARGATGCIVTLGKGGDVECLRGMYDSANAKSVMRALQAPTRAAGSGDGDGADEARGDDKRDSASPVRGETDSMARRLSAQRTMALQALMAAQPERALRILVYTLAHEAFGSGYTVGPLKIRLDDREHVLRASDPTFGEAKARKELELSLAVWRARWPSDEDASFEFVRDLPTEQLLELLALLSARGLDATVARDRDGRSPEAFATYLSLDMTAWWTAGATTYLASMPKARLVEIVTEVHGAEKAKPIAPMKKAEAVAEVERLLAGTNWLPPLLRH